MEPRKTPEELCGVLNSVETKIGQRWVHRESRKQVIIVATVFRESDCSILVIYQHAGEEPGIPWARPLGEFWQKFVKGEGAEPCEHEAFQGSLDVHRITDHDGGPVVRFSANVRCTCLVCNKQFRFMGLPIGLDMDGAAVSVDGCEARLSMAPPGEVLTPLEGVTGFTYRRSK